MLFRSHSLARFDGTYLYEHEDPRQGYHPHWNTHIFNYGRNEVAGFLIGSALFYLDKMHVDGFRVDAVTSMLHLDYGRGEGEWIPNGEGGRDNFEAIAFLKRLNAIVHERHPGVIMIAEESSNYTGITSEIGFDMSWSLGWMNDTLRFFETPFSQREAAFPSLLHAFSYCFDEAFLLPLSHDEVVHGKKSLASKMPGNEFEVFAGMRLLLSYMVCHPGKLLLFMGGEFGQWGEWNCKRHLDWVLTELPYHKGLLDMVAALLSFARNHAPLYERDHTEAGFEWVSRDYPLLAYYRIARSGRLLCLHNMSNVEIETPLIDGKEVLFSTDEKRFGGRGALAYGMPPLTTVIAGGE